MFFFYFFFEKVCNEVDFSDRKILATICVIIFE